MASNRNYYTWQAQDSLWTVAAKFLDVSGYSNPITLAETIRASNLQILDWAHVPVGTVIYLPLVSYQ